MSGFGTRDRRPVNPPPIVQLLARHSDPRRKFNWQDLDNLPLLLYAELVCPQTGTPLSLVMNRAALSSHAERLDYVKEHNYRQASPSSEALYPSVYSRNLIGTFIESPRILKDLDNRQGLFWVFRDLSIRVEGTYMLKFSLVDMMHALSPPNFDMLDMLVEPLLPRVQDDSFPVMLVGYSHPVRAYNPKVFPGMLEPTELMKCFAKQGVRLTVWKVTRHADGRDEEEEASVE